MNQVEEIMLGLTIGGLIGIVLVLGFVVTAIKLKWNKRFLNWLDR